MPQCAKAATLLFQANLMNSVNNKQSATIYSTHTYKERVKWAPN